MAKKFRRSYTFDKDTIDKLEQLAQWNKRSLTNMIEISIDNEYRREVDNIGEENN